MASSFTPPFHDEESFKTWQTVATKAKLPHGSPPRPLLPGDGVAPDEHESKLVDELEALILPEYKDMVDKHVLQRYTRGYSMRSYVNAPDRVERTAVMLNLACKWRQEVDIATLPSRAVEGRQDWERLFPQCYPGIDGNGRAMYYMMIPGDIMALPKEMVKNCHYQDMARLEIVKARLFPERIAKGQAPFFHHTLVVDLGNPDSALGRAMISCLKDAALHPMGPNVTQHFFPDFLEKAYIINAPLVFRALWTVAKLFIEASTAEKYNIVGGGYESVLEADGIGRGQLPMCIGGTAPNPVGYLQKVKCAHSGTELELVVPADATAVTWEIASYKGEECSVTIMKNAVQSAAGTTRAKKDASAGGWIASAVEAVDARVFKGTLAVAPGDTLILRFACEKGTSSCRMRLEMEGPAPWRPL